MQFYLSMGYLQANFQTYIVQIMTRTLNLSVPRGGRDLVGQIEATQLVLLVGQWVVKGVDTDVLPETVEAVLLGSGTGTGNLEDTTSDLKGHVRGGDLDSGHRLGNNTTLTRSQGLLLVNVLVEQVGDLLAGLVRQSVRSADAGEVAAVLGQDVVLIESRLLGVVGEGPWAGGGQGVATSTLESATGNTVVEVGEDKLEDRAEESAERSGEDLLDGLPVGNVESNGVVPGEGDVLNLAGARLGKTHTHVVPVVGELEARLLGGDNGEDVVVGLHVDTFQDDEVGEGTTCGEVLETVENEVITLGSDAAVVVTGIHCSSNECVGLHKNLLPALLLLLVSDDTGNGGPLQVVTQEHTNGSIQYPN